MAIDRKKILAAWRKFHYTVISETPPMERFLNAYEYGYEKGADGKTVESPKEEPFEEAGFEAGYNDGRLRITERGDAAWEAYRARKRLPGIKR